MDDAPPPAPSEDTHASAARVAAWAAPVGVTLLTSIAVTAVSYGAPDAYATTAVGLCFFAVTYALVLRGDTRTVREHGLSLGGLFEPEPIVARRVVQDTGLAIVWAGAAAAVFFPAYWLGYREWFEGADSFTLGHATVTLDETLGELLVIALPEEMFFRGYLQSRLDRVWPPRTRLLGATVGPALLVTSVLFALGHIATQPHVDRLAVFFPSLAFGWLRARTAGVGAGVVFHAGCNLFATVLGRGYALLP